VHLCHFKLFRNKGEFYEAVHGTPSCQERPVWDPTSNIVENFMSLRLLVDASDAKTLMRKYANEIKMNASSVDLTNTASLGTIHMAFFSLINLNFGFLNLISISSYQVFNRPERYGPQVPGYDSRFGSPSKPYIDANPGAAHCWPISVHIRFGFNLIKNKIILL
jgi:hypothetical protein